jgi:hypothetical protein
VRLPVVCRRDVGGLAVFCIYEYQLHWREGERHAYDYVTSFTIGFDGYRQGDF